MYKLLGLWIIAIMSLNVNASLIVIESDMQQGECYNSDLSERVNCEKYLFGTSFTSHIIIDIDDSTFDHTLFQDTTYNPVQYVEYKFTDIIESISITFDNQNLKLIGQNSVDVGHDINNLGNMLNEYRLSLSESYFNFNMTLTGFEGSYIKNPKSILDFDSINLTRPHYKGVSIGIYDNDANISTNIFGGIKSIKLVSVPEPTTLGIMVFSLFLLWIRIRNNGKPNRYLTNK